MAQLEELYAALKNADAAGDTAAAQKLASYIQGMDAQKPQTNAFKQGARDLIGGALRGAGSIGATIAAPYDYAMDYIEGDRGKNLSSLVTGKELPSRNQERRDRLDENARNLLGSDTNSWLYKGGKIGGEIAGTAGAGGVLGNVAARFGASAPIVEALATSGMRVGGMVGPKALALRTAAGAVAGGVQAGMVDPQQAPSGALVGAALPGVLKGAGALAEKAGASMRNLASRSVSPEVAKLATRAKELGIDVPADRLVDSRPMNAVAAGLNYVPFSGRAGSEDKMVSQLNKAVSKTFGQDSSNVTMALRKAADDLGGKFDSTLRNNGVQFDKQLLDDISTVYNKAEAELGSDALKPITSKVNDLIAKGGEGVIDGQAAYNIKRELDRIGRGNTPSAFHALELKGVLMEALNRSLGPDKAAAFATTRQQYGNMLALEKLAKNGVEGEISAARLANMKNINNEPLQELADIAAQFVKQREGQHGGAQRAAAAGITAVLGGPAGLAALSGGGRVANMALNSNTLKNAMTGQALPPNKLATLLSRPEAQELLVRSAPVLAGQ